MKGEKVEGKGKPTGQEPDDASYSEEISGDAQT